MRLSQAVLLAVSAPFTLAIPVITVPSTSLTAATAITITIADSGVAPLLTSLASYQLQLYAGNDATKAVLWTDPTPGTFTTLTKTVTIPAAIGGIAPNAYFFGVLATATAGGTITTFSNRFSMVGMTGTFPTTVITTGITSTAGPPTVNAIAAVANAPAAAIGDGVASDFAVPYNMQTGTVRYAPMQPIPGTAITKTATTPLWPTSAVQFATTFLPIPTIVTTKTQAATFSVSSHANNAAAASSPVNDMQKYLNRWKD